MMDSTENMDSISQPSKGLKPFEGSDKEADYYLENGLLVFTAAYHLRRGYCCKNNCRHCPYGFRKKK